MRPLRIGPPTADQDVPRPVRRPADRTRRLAQLAEARGVLAVLPGEGERVHGLITTRFCVMDMLEAIIGELGTIREMAVGTLSYSRANADTLGKWIAAKTVGRLDLLVSSFFRRHNKGLFEDVRSMFADAGPDFQIAARRNHAKIVAMSFES